MPNHCESDLYIYGNKAEIARFLEAVRSDRLPIDADKIIPYPKEFRDLDEAAEKARANGAPLGSVKDGFNSGGYEWCVKNWGTKWGMYDFSPITERARGIKISFSSAWAPPYPVIQRASELFPKLRFRLKYFESGVQFQGSFGVKAGVVISHVERFYRGNRGG